MLVLTELEADKIEESLRKDHFFWLDLENPTTEVIHRTAELLRLHPVAVEDSIEFGQRPKIDTYDDHLLIVYYTARVNGDHTASSIEIHLYLAGGFVVTMRRDHCTALEDL